MSGFGKWGQAGHIVHVNLIRPFDLLYIRLSPLSEFIRGNNIVLIVESCVTCTVDRSYDRLWSTILSESNGLRYQPDREIRRC